MSESLYDCLFEEKFSLEPCMDRDIFFQCPKDYPHSCIDRNFRCNGRVECPSGDDERDCDDYSYSPSSRLMIIVLVVLGSIFLICVLSTGNIKEKNNEFLFLLN